MAAYALRARHADRPAGLECRHKGRNGCIGKQRGHGEPEEALGQEWNGRAVEGVKIPTLEGYRSAAGQQSALRRGGATRDDLLISGGVEQIIEEKLVDWVVEPRAAHRAEGRY